MKTTNRGTARGARLKFWVSMFALAAVFSACAPASVTPAVTTQAHNSKSPAARNPGSIGSQAAPGSLVTAAPTQVLPTPQSTATLAAYGPDSAKFPAGFNPLTGQPTINPTLLQIPAVLVSISHFPATVRPQAGLSFAPFVFEFSITGGESRFLAAFYGQFPASEVPIGGDCVVRRGVFKQIGTILGNLVWLDTNGNGTQDSGEPGIPGICVDLYDSRGNVLQQTTTDTNGFYGFNVVAGESYILHFSKPAGLELSLPNLGDDNTDSDAGRSTGDTPLIEAEQTDRRWDAGLIPSAATINAAASAQSLPKPEVGPVRSGRLLYAYIAGFYQDSCLIYAFASPEVLEKLPHCAFVSHEEAGGGELISIERMKAVAEDNMRHTATRPFNYSGNAFSQLPPPGGVPAQQINVFFGNLNQSGWTYDPLYEAYLRYVDTADPAAKGVLHAEVDRLTGRQLHFENVIVVMADTEVVTRSNLDIHLDEGNSGHAYLFRNGQVFPIEWSTVSGEYEQRTGFRRPIQFLNQDGFPVALKPGHTWVIIVTPFSLVQSQSPGIYKVTYEAPAGEAR